MPTQQSIAPELLDENRLRALQETGLLDSAPEANFDRFTYLTKCLLDAPIALITLVDQNRQFFKSSIGLPEPVATSRETPLSYSFCQHVVSSGNPLRVDDATTHDLLCHNRSVIEFSVIAYIGVPLCTQTGHVIGTLCALDVKQRTWTDNDLDHLKMLANLVMTELVLRDQLTARNKAEERLTQKAAELEKANEDLHAALLKEKQLTVERDHAIDASRIKSHFLATVSHEIRTPLNGIIGMADLMTFTSLTKEQKEYIQIINSSGNHLLTIINDILDLSRIEAGKMSLDNRAFDLHGTVLDTIDLFVSEATEKGLDIALQIDPTVPRYVTGDTHRFRQILTNLVGNAIKFTHQGGVKVEIKGIDTSADFFTVRIDVHDTGIGISPDNQDRLFKPFSQVDSSSNRKYGGTGLGLVISKRLAELMGGSISFSSEPGIGSVFQVDVVFQK